MSQSMKYVYKHIVVVHGIGDQAPNETVLSFINEFIRALPGSEDGSFEIEVDNVIESVDSITKPPTAGAGASVQTFRPAFFIFKNKSANLQHVISFSEVYWRQIPDRYIEKNDGFLPIPIFTWARSINTRFLGRGAEYHLASEAIGNLEAMLQYIKSLASINKQSKRFHEITEKFLGDVQVYAESDEIHQEINNRFFSVLSRINDFMKHTETVLKERDINFNGFEEEDCGIYVIAHSEGTVIAYNSLVQAASYLENNAAVSKNSDVAARLQEYSAQFGSWFPKVKGLVTMGSPIDKHYAIWPSRFRRNNLVQSREVKIPWFNFWDYSDPVGYGLRVLFPGPKDPIRDSCPDQTTDAEKLFGPINDSGFTRYAIPGLAHVKYWQDNAIYENIIDRVMGLGTSRKSTAVTTRRWLATLHPIADYFSYGLGRVAVLWMILFYGSKIIGGIAGFVLCSPGKDWIPGNASALFFGPIANSWARFGCVLALFLLVNLIWKGYIHTKGVLAKTLKGLHFVFIAIASLAALGFSLANVGPAPVSLKDYLGYGMGMVVTILVWKLHTVVQRGIIQLWRYTKGVDTDSRKH